MRKTARIWLLSFLLLGFAEGMSAQNSASSPYSLFGIGELNDNVPNAYRQMGGVGIGMRSNRVIDPMQPASYTACDSLTFMFDVALSASWSNYKDATGVRNRANGNLEYITLQLPLWRQHIALSLGVLPFSSSGYSLTLADSTSIPNFPHTKTYQGSGYISQFYGGLSFNILDWFAVGGNFYYMFGSSTKNRQLEFANAAMTPSFQADYINVSSFRYRVGAQFFHKFSDDQRFVLGGIFESKMPLKSTTYLIESTTEDTIPSVSDIFDKPLMWGVGASYCYKGRLTLAFDFMRQQWSQARYYGTADYYRDRDKYSLGIEYRNDPLSRQYVDQVMWRLGGSVSNAYFYEQKGPEFTISTGVGLPLHGVGTHINMTLEYTHRGTTKTLADNTLKFTINAAIAETWFFKRKI